MSKIILSKNFVRVACKLALNEDLYPSGDITSELISHNIKKNVKLISNQNGIIGGLEFAKQTFKLIDKTNIKFDKYFTSFQKRAINTLEIILNVLNKKNPQIKNPHKIYTTIF